MFTKDIHSWGYTEGSVDDLISKDLFDKDQAFNYMLTDETNKIKEMGEELQFYSNQCLDEVKRVAKDNGDALVDFFMENAQMQCDYTEQEFNKWSEFVSYFGSLQWDKPDSDDEEGKEVKKRKKEKKEKKDKKEKK